MDFDCRKRNLVKHKKPSRDTLFWHTFHVVHGNGNTVFHSGGILCRNSCCSPGELSLSFFGAHSAAGFSAACVGPNVGLTMTSASTADGPRDALC